ncbi:hypothetical protein [Naasia aerilata]|uniref:Uncharacterized protein n=1 Tax=Naasia aerilata TaxID=1162966 RepID=A0ABN6XMR7_9MICO|nr:hypothetical protein [Naasia aerilata]BDZ44723.1 hypothetical protein GCM10025866_06320 [Naasia aerilata]
MIRVMVIHLPPWLLPAILGGLAMTALLVVSMVKTVRYHGWGQQRWAPPAVPWFIAAMVVGVGTLAATLLWISRG